MFGIAKAKSPSWGTRATLDHLYTEITRQALSPWFYTHMTAKPSFTDKFDVNVLHAHLLLDRLGRDSAIPETVPRRLRDVLFGNWDFALRESGVGDMSVGKHMRRVADGFYGRAVAYNEALEQLRSDANGATLENVLQRNLPNFTETPDQLRRLQSYVVGLYHYLWDCEAESFRGLQFRLPPAADLAAQGQQLLQESGV